MRIPLPSQPTVVALASGPARTLEALRLGLSAVLAERKRDAGLTQPEVAEKLGTSVTSVGHAETGRVWQGREFWGGHEELLGGDLLGLYDRYKAGEVTPGPPAARHLRSRARPR